MRVLFVVRYFMGFSIGSPSDHKQASRDVSSPLRQSLPNLILRGFVVYLILFGIALKNHQTRMDRFEKMANGIHTQLIVKNKEKPLKKNPLKQVTLRSKGPVFFKPLSVFCAFLCVHKMDSEAVEALKDMIVSFKDNLFEVNLLAIDLSGKETDLSHAKLSGANLVKAKLSNTNFSNADLHEADLREARLSGANLRGVNLFKANLSGADLRDARLSASDLRGVNFFYADLQGADLSEARLRDVKLSGADFRKVNFFNADLSGAVLSGARLDEANLTGANLLEADLRYADLSGTIGLTQNMLDRVIVDENTQLPEGLKVPE